MSKLILIATPIGNIEDISIRAMRSVFEIDIVLAEDTRQFGKLKGILKEKYSKLFEELNITENRKQRIFSYREQNHSRVVNAIKDRLREDLTVGLFTDAGMPGISDPGYQLIHDVLDSGFEIDVIPGPTAVSSALVLSGLPTDRYSFLGFLPRKDIKAKKLINEFLNDDTTVVIFESPFRIIKTVGLILDLNNSEEREDNRNIQVAAVNDITKKFQAVYRGTPETVLNELKNIKVQGEWVICLRNNNY